MRWWVPCQWAGTGCSSLKQTIAGWRGRTHGTMSRGRHPDGCTITMEYLGLGGAGFHTRLGARRGRGGCRLREVLEYTCSAGWRDERFALGLQVVAEFSQLCVVLWDADEDVPGYFHHFSSATFFVKRRTHFVPSRAVFNLRRTVKGEIICDHHTNIKKAASSR